MSWVWIEFELIREKKLDGYRKAVSSEEFAGMLLSPSCLNCPFKRIIQTTCFNQNCMWASLLEVRHGFWFPRIFLSWDKITNSPEQCYFVRLNTQFKMNIQSMRFFLFSKSFSFFRKQIYVKSDFLEVPAPLPLNISILLNKLQTSLLKAENDFAC